MRKLILAYLEFTTMTTLLDNAVFNSKLLDQVPLDLLLGPLGALFEDVVGAPQLVYSGGQGRGNIQELSSLLVHE